MGTSVFIHYIDRSNLSIAAQLGFLLSAFFWTYACFQLVSGWLVDRWNVSFRRGIRTPVRSRRRDGVGPNLRHACCDCCWALAESVSYPSYSKIVAFNFREEQRGRAI